MFLFTYLEWTYIKWGLLLLIIKFVTLYYLSFLFLVGLLIFVDEDECIFTDLSCFWSFVCAVIYNSKFYSSFFTVGCGWLLSFDSVVSFWIDSSVMVLLELFILLFLVVDGIVDNGAIAIFYIGLVNLIWCKEAISVFFRLCMTLICYGILYIEVSFKLLVRFTFLLLTQIFYVFSIHLVFLVTNLWPLLILCILVFSHNFYCIWCNLLSGFSGSGFSVSFFHHLDFHVNLEIIIRQLPPQPTNLESISSCCRPYKSPVIEDILYYQTQRPVSEFELFPSFLDDELCPKHLQVLNWDLMELKEYDKLKY